MSGPRWPDALDGQPRQKRATPAMHHYPSRTRHAALSPSAEHRRRFRLDCRSRQRTADHGLVVLRRNGRQRRSIALEAESRHLMTDMWTSAGVLIGVAGVGISGWHWLDAVVALLV